MSTLFTFSSFVCQTVESVFGELPPLLVRVLDRMVKQLVDELPLKETCGFDLKEAEMFISEKICPFLRDFVEHAYQGSPDPQMLGIVTPYLAEALVEELKNGEVRNMEDILTKINNVIPFHFITTFKTSKMKNVMKLAETVAEKAPSSFPDFVKALKNSVCVAVLPEVREQMMAAIDRLVDYIDNMDPIEQDRTSFISLIIPVLTPYIQIDVLKCLESKIKEALKTIKFRAGKVFKRTGAKVFDRVENKVREATLSTSLSGNLFNFEEFLLELLNGSFSDLKGEIEMELKAVVQDLKEQVKHGVDEYVSVHLIPKLSKLIESQYNVSPEKQLRLLKPFIIKGLDIFLKEGRILNKAEIIDLARRSVPPLITETVIPNAEESTKKRVEKVVAAATNTALDTGLTKDVLTNCLPVAATEILIPEASESTKKLVQDTLNTIQGIVFASGTTPSVEKLFETLLDKCGDKVFCLCRDKLLNALDDLIAKMPDDADEVMEFLMKHVLPVLSVCFQASAFGIITIFLLQSFERLHKEGTVKGRHFVKPLVSVVAKCAMNVAKRKMVKNGIEEVSTVVTEKAATEKVTKFVVKKVGRKAAARTAKKLAMKASKNAVSKVTHEVSSKGASTAGQNLGKKVAKEGVKIARKATHKTVGKISKTVGKTTYEKVSGKVATEVSKKVTAKQGLEVGAKAVNSVGGKAADEGLQIVAEATKKTSAKISQKLSDKVSNSVTTATTKGTIKTTAEGVTTTSVKKATEKSVKLTGKTANKVSQTSSEAVAKVGVKNAAKAGLSAAGISAAIGGVFLYRDMNELSDKRDKGVISEQEYKEQKVERIGEYAGDVIGTGVVGTAVTLAAFTGPAGWAAIGAGMAFSYATGKLGGVIAKSLF